MLFAVFAPAFPLSLLRQEIRPQTAQAHSLGRWQQAEKKERKETNTAATIAENEKKLEYVYKTTQPYAGEMREVSELLKFADTFSKTICKTNIYSLQTEHFEVLNNYIYVFTNNNFL